MRIRKGYSFLPSDFVSSTTTHQPQQKSGGGDGYDDENYYVSLPLSCVSQNQQNQCHADTGYSPPPVMVSRIKASIDRSEKNPRTGSGDEGSTSTTMETSVNGYGKSCNSMSTETSATSSVSSSLSRHGWWCEEEKLFPLKKRKISLERFMTQESENNRSRIKIDNGAVYKERIEMNLRCCKTNGKGWRCSRKRLDSYAWCEYHIKKSRFRDWKKSDENGNRYWGLKKKKNIVGHGGRKDFMVGNINKKRKRTMLISSILERTVPLLANNSITS